MKLNFPRPPPVKTTFWRLLSKGSIDHHVPLHGSDGPLLGTAAVRLRATMLMMIRKKHLVWKFGIIFASLEQIIQLRKKSDKGKIGYFAAMRGFRSKFIVARDYPRFNRTSVQTEGRHTARRSRFTRDLLICLTDTAQPVNADGILIVDLLNGDVRLVRLGHQGFTGDDVTDMIGIPEFAVIVLLDRLR